MSASFDAAVVGAGPAGATCALGLARAGLRVALLERDALPRYKTCGGGLVGRARDLLEIDLDGVVERECRSLDLYMRRRDADREELTFTVERPRPVVTMTMRADLDQRLADEACRAGAFLLAPRRLRSLASGDREVEIGTDGGTVRARYVVAADGAGSVTARAAGWRDRPAAIAALESEVETSASDFERLSGSARFDLGTPAGGYAWVFPKRTHLSVGCLSCVERPRLKEVLDGYLRRLGLAGAPRRDHGFIIPIRPRRQFVRGRVLLTGDAAGLADPVTCEGISWAILSGRLAAQSITARFDDAAAAGRLYLRLLRRKILRELRIARPLAALLYRHRAFRDFFFGRLGQPFSEAMTDLFLGETSYHKLVFRPRTWFRLASRLLRVR